MASHTTISETIARMADPAGVHEIVCNVALPDLAEAARGVALASFGQVVTYSPKVFVPLTRLCRDVCHYCTFATTPAKIDKPFLEIEDVVEIARAGARSGCREALFTLGDRPEARYSAAREWLDRRGYESTIAYVAKAAAAVLDETGLLPHINAGILEEADYALLRPNAASMGLMLESASGRLCERGGPHFGSPDKLPERRIASIAAAGQARVPFTSGILIGIGETRSERVEALVALRNLHRKYGHIQEIIVQNFRAKPGTLMEHQPEPSLEDHLWSIAVARLIMPGEVSIQAPPNLRPDHLDAMISAGLNDWGGISPVTPDHVNPEAPWPNLRALEEATNLSGRVLRPRLVIGRGHAAQPDEWVDERLRTTVRRSVDARGLPRVDGWISGAQGAVPQVVGKEPRTVRVAEVLDHLSEGGEPDEQVITALFEADGGDVRAITTAADQLRREVIGDTVTYVVNRNINYTNICLYKCGFCGFSKGSTRALRGPAYNLELEEIARRAEEAAARGATEVCLQGGIHPDFDGKTYLAILNAVRTAAPDLHVHAFSPLEIFHGATTLGLSVRDFLSELRDAGLSSLPGTAAEVFDPAVRSIIAPDKVTGREWLAIMRDAHGVGLRSTATLMFGHIDGYVHWARHLLELRNLQAETGGFTEFVPLPFVHMQAPMWIRGQTRNGPTWRETILMHAIARLVLHPLVRNIQASWVKLGADGAAAVLDAGANDLGGVLMDESITRSAGGTHGQQMEAGAMARIAARTGRPVSQRTTLYENVKRAESGAALERI